MVKLYEFQGKSILEREGIRTPKGFLAETPEEARSAAEKIGKKVIIKSQVLATGRYKAGAIKFAETPQEVENIVKELLGKNVKGYTVEKVLVEEAVDIDKEMFLSIIVNDSYKVKGPEIIFSPEGGIDIEQLAIEAPEKIGRLIVDYVEGVDRKKLSEMLKNLGIEQEILKDLVDFITKTYNVFRKYDCRVVEINPIALSRGKLYAADCKITIDDSSTFRHPEFEFDVPRDMHRPPTELEKIAWKIEENDYRGTAYFVQLSNEPPVDKGEGYVAFHGIGGGASMLAADTLLKRGLKIANYADSSGNPPASKIYRLIKVILSQPEIEGYVLMGCVFASQEQWHHAHAIVKAFREEADRLQGFPVVVLIAGNKERESIEILKKGFKDLPYRFEVYGRDYIYDPEYIAERVVELVKEYRMARGKGQ
ncbi:MAG: acetate--CoA ligase family protein [Archaeoglobaceae archaeon]|nr:acetate--CoA ligase family protein [Archaeoglobaceae archaeon]